MDRKKCLKRWMLQTCLGAVAFSGCGPAARFKAWKDQSDISYYQNYATKIEYPDVQSFMEPQIANAPLPLMIENPSELPTWDLKLSEAIHAALMSSEILRSLGGSVVSAPQATASNYDAALSDSNPLGGIDAALSAFDAQVGTNLFWQKNARPNNNSFLALFPSTALQTLGVFQSNLTKTTATGTQFAVRHNMTYDRNNNPTRLFPSDFVGFFEAEMRHPLMQGSGTTYNRIAGPGRVIGQYNGILIARINTDITLADFEQGVIGLINDVETAYWELYFAYRALDAQVEGRKSVLENWRQVIEKAKVSVRGGESHTEAEVRSLLHQFTTQVNDALAGPNGLYAAEQRLRYVMGIAASDGRLIKPADQPILAEVEYDWQSALSSALTQRVEIRRQKWTIKRRELELMAARMNRKPRLDAVTQYRWRGLGDHLIGDTHPTNDFDNVYQSIFGGDFQEWQAGMELSYPVGFRQASAAIRFAQLNLARESSLLEEQELRISHDLSNAARQIERSYIQVITNFERLEADRQRVSLREVRLGAGIEDVFFALQAKQQLAISTSSYYRALVDYTLALRDFHRQKGSLLAYNQVQLSEANWPDKAYRDAYERGRYFTPREQAPRTPQPISRGEFDPSQP